MFKKRKLIEVTQDSFIVCDNENCNYEIPYNPELRLEGFIGDECPNCGEILLTEQDVNIHNKMMKIVNFINKYFSWITYFYKDIKEEDYQVLDVKVHKGITIRKKDDN